MDEPVTKGQEGPEEALAYSKRRLQLWKVSILAPTQGRVIQLIIVSED